MEGDIVDFRENPAIGSPRQTNAVDPEAELRVGEPMALRVVRYIRVQPYPRTCFSHFLGASCGFINSILLSDSESPVAGKWSQHLPALGSGFIVLAGLNEEGEDSSNQSGISIRHMYYDYNRGKYLNVFRFGINRCAPFSGGFVSSGQRGGSFVLHSSQITSV